MKFVASTYDFQNNIIRDGYNYDGKKIVTFSNILNNNTFPLAEILSDLLEIGQREMNKPIEIEFAVNLDRQTGMRKIFHFLQIRPIVDNINEVDVSLDDIKQEDVIIEADSALGNGIITDVYDFVYIKPESFKASDSKKIADEVEKINEIFVNEKKNYILVGPGRWGSSDPWLGIPVKWGQISAARTIVEAGLQNYRIDPSQGTHFFQNITSFKVGYFTINPYIKDGYYDLDFLSSVKPFYETDYIRHLKFDKPLVIKIDGKTNKGVILKPV